MISSDLVRKVHLTITVRPQGHLSWPGTGRNGQLRNFVMPNFSLYLLYLLLLVTFGQTFLSEDRKRKKVSWIQSHSFFISFSLWTSLSTQQPEKLKTKTIFHTFNNKIGSLFCNFCHMGKHYVSCGRFLGKNSTFTYFMPIYIS